MVLVKEGYLLYNEIASRIEGSSDLRELYARRGCSLPDRKFTVHLERKLCGMKKKDFGFRICRKVLLAVILTGMLLGTVGCSKKETFSLDSEDLVRMENLDEGNGTARGAASGMGSGKASGEYGDASGGIPKEVPGSSMSAGECGEDAMIAGNGNEALGEQGKRVEESTLFVHICGEVVRPGVYELPGGSRVYEAVEEAGGFTKEAAADYVNLAYILEDGWKIEIPSWEMLDKDVEGKAVCVSSGISSDERQAGMEEESGNFGGNGTEGGLVDINTATKQELMTLPGVGESRAESIISYREKNGGFSRIEDIMKVEGIKDGMFAKMKDKICVRGVK